MKKPKNQKRLMSFLTLSFVLILITFYGPGIVAKATGPQESINILTDILFGIIRAIGVILLGFGIVQIGRRNPSHISSFFFIHPLHIFTNFLDEITFLLFKSSNSDKISISNSDFESF